MIKEALQYIVGLGKAEEHMINGACYSDKPLHRIDTYYPKADAIEMHTLTSLVDYIKSEVDEMPPRMIVEVKSPTEGEQTADFISCVAFGKAAEFAEKYLRQGTKIAITGRIQTGSYTNREGQKVYTTDVVVEEQEFAESKSASAGNGGAAPQTADPDGFMSLPDGIDEELPFN